MVNLITFSEDKIKELKEKSFLELEKNIEVENLNKFREEYLSKKEGIIPKIINWISHLKKQENKVKFGTITNEWRKTLIEKLNILERKAKNLKKNKDNQDFNPNSENRVIKIGSLHPIRKMINDIYDFFSFQGYQIYETSEIENEDYNFNKLNMEIDHQARSDKDTFYIQENNSLLLRTHTSNFQVRVMEKNKNKEIKVISGGKVYRRDRDDSTHSHQYTNVDVLVVGRNIGITDLKGTLENFFKWIFNESVKIRLRHSFFPFTEPSIEVDCSCTICEGKGCSTCKQTGWIEVLGAGLIHPNVLKNGGFDQKEFTGFAFGMGVERIIMIKYGIKDIRDFYLNDLRFIGQTKWK
jgi:phenylalanyl-tRNA synthetase alpha chain